MQTHNPQTLDVIVRPARPDDAAIAGRLIDELGYAAPPEEAERRFARVLADDDVAVLIAERAGSIAGLATVHVLRVINRSAPVAWLTALVVAHEQRRRGVGRALVAAVERHARALGCERLSVTTHDDRADAHDFYLGVGLERTGRRFGKPLVTP